MAATGYTPIQLYYSTTAGHIPTAGNLLPGELALNVTDGKLYFNQGGTVNIIASTTTVATGTVTSVSGSGGTTGLTLTGGPITTSGTLTLGGTLATLNGGTGQVTYTDGQLLIGNSSTGSLTKSTLTAGTGITITNANGSITIASSISSGTTTNSVVFNNSGAGNVSGTSFNGSAAVAVSYNTIGAPSATGSGASGTWGISISGNAATATTATTATSATTATTATNLSGGTVAATTGTFSGASVALTNASGILYVGGTTAGTGVSYLSTSAVTFGVNNSMTWDGANFDWTINNVLKMQLTNSGSTYNVTGTYGVISDARIKENITPAGGYLDAISKLNVVNYTLKSDPETTHLGFIAQEVEQVLPSLVETAPSKQYNIEDFKMVKSSNLIPMLVKAIQELQAEVQALKSQQ